MNDPCNYSVEISREDLVFSAAHFITFDDHEGREICETLHGHNYRVRCTVAGPVGSQGYVVDFIALRHALGGVIGRLDHRVLLPDSHPRIAVTAGETEVSAVYDGRRWVFPATDVAILPLANTTAELLAAWILGRLLAEHSGLFRGIGTVAVGVDENGGQWGWARAVNGS